MAADDLASIPGMQDKHRRVLSERLGIATSQGLADADPQSILDAMRRMKPPPTLDEIELWQDRARRQRAAAVPASVEWDQAASFVVVFEYRQLEAGVEHRLAVEHTEVEPVQPPKIWPDWDCQEICSWMRDRVDLLEVAPRDDDASRPTEGAAPEVSKALRIERITLKEATREVDMLAAGAYEAASPLTVSGKARLEVMVAGVAPDHEVWIQARSTGAGEARVVLHDPSVVSAGESVEVDLAALPVGDSDMRVVVWTPDASARPHGVNVAPVRRLADGPGAEATPSPGVTGPRRHASGEASGEGRIASAESDAPSEIR